MTLLDHGSAHDPGPATAQQQVRSLIGLRWRMIRTPGIKLGICVALVGLAWLLQLVLVSAPTLEAEVLGTTIELAPQIFLGFGALAFIAPLSAGGGTQVVPPDQLVAFPVRPGTHFLGGLYLAPANLVWVTQLVVLAAETAYLTYRGHLLPGLVTSLAYVLAVTLLGQALAWGVSGLRQTRAGRRAVLTLVVVLTVTAVVVLRLGQGGAALDRSPTRLVVDGLVAGARGDWVTWAVTTAVLLGLAAGGLVLGTRACAWAVRRPNDATNRSESVGVRRRRTQRSALRELVAVDRASVWRAPALRRGGLVLALLPGVAAAGAQVPWESLIVLPGLVAAGAGLLFGVNAFALDGSGAVWLASLPHDPALLLRAKLVVLAETVVGAALLAGVAGSLRSPGTPNLAEAVAIASAFVACTASVLAGCAALSVRHPHRADLRGPRDSIAPPGALILASVRLALPAAVTGIVLESSARTGVWWVAPLLAGPLIGWSVWSLRRSAAQWDQPAVRARVVQSVSAG